MLNIGWGEFLIIGIVALIVIGPKELPGVLRMVGQWMTKLRRMASEFQGQFQEAMREAEMADLKKQVDDMTTQAKSYADFDPIGDVRKEVESTQQQIESAISDPSASTPTAAGPSPVPAAAAEPATPPVEPAASAPAPAAIPEASFNVDAPVASAPPPPQLEGVGAAAEPVKPDAGGKPA
jgi:sec-independent protein translocase protein TatB